MCLNDCCCMICYLSLCVLNIYRLVGRKYQLSRPCRPPAPPPPPPIQSQLPAAPFDSSLAQSLASSITSISTLQQQQQDKILGLKQTDIKEANNLKDKIGDNTDQSIVVDNTGVMDKSLPSSSSYHSTLKEVRTATTTTIIDNNLQKEDNENMASKKRPHPNNENENNEERDGVSRMRNSLKNKDCEVTSIEKEEKDDDNGEEDVIIDMEDPAMILTKKQCILHILYGLKKQTKVELLSTIQTELQGGNGFGGNGFKP
mmetsp:Transcript_27261/g.35310  ORF Transcript_27261/g.35310 Transcript_27261/m.35310 type:complete len:258 (-) Transcript_27261:130-903(-)